MMPDIPMLGVIIEKHIEYLNESANENKSFSDTTDHERKEDDASFVCLQLLRLAIFWKHCSTVMHRHHSQLANFDVYVVYTKTINNTPKYRLSVFMFDILCFGHDELTMKKLLSIPYSHNSFYF